VLACRRASTERGGYNRNLPTRTLCEFPDYNLKFYASEKGPLISRIKFKEINFIALAGSDTTIIKTDSTYFFNLKKDNRLYRKLTSGEIEIFDNLFNVTERPGLVHEEDLILVLKGKLTRIHSRKELIQLLEKYGHSFQPEDTVTLGAIIKAINSRTVLQ
jgi:hypothetical protein